MEKRKDTQQRIIRRRYEEKHSVERKEKNKVWGTSLGRKYAEEIDAFLKVLEQRPEVELVHPAREHGWGQRVVRLYDPDRHIIEVGESMAKVARRFFDSGLSEEASYPPLSTADGGDVRISGEARRCTTGRPRPDRRRRSPAYSP